MDAQSPTNEALVYRNRRRGSYSCRRALQIGNLNGWLSRSGNPALRDFPRRTAHLFKDAISVAKSDAVTKSYFGGRPPLSAHYAWPTRNGRPLAFLACIDCSELPRSADLDWLPSSGLLLFFYDLKDQPWGFDPKDRGGSATVYVPAAEVGDRSSLATPPVPLDADSVLPQRHVAFHLTKFPPSWESPELKALGLKQAEMDRFMDQREALYGNKPHHQVGGFADPVQNPEMDEECQLVTQGLYCGDSSGYNDPRAAKLKEAAGEWSLLFQMDSDDDLHTMWGDAGMIYFWVRRSEARNLKFDNTWVILQCG
jgi:uncharacterized protein YwqG